MFADDFLLFLFQQQSSFLADERRGVSASIAGSHGRKTVVFSHIY
jgi:hypothetical protein